MRDTNVKLKIGKNFIYQPFCPSFSAIEVDSWHIETANTTTTTTTNKTHDSNKPLEANKAKHTPPKSQSFQGFPLYTLPGSSHLTQIFFYDILPPQPRTTCYPFSPRRKGKSLAICHPSAVERALAISTFLSL